MMEIAYGNKKKNLAKWYAKVYDDDTDALDGRPRFDEMLLTFRVQAALAPRVQRHHWPASRGARTDPGPTKHRSFSKIWTESSFALLLRNNTTTTNDNPSIILRLQVNSGRPHPIYKPLD